MEREFILEVKDLGKSFKNLEVLKSIDLNVKKGDVVAIIGPSGSGKSTMLRCLNRLEEPTKGQILFHGTNILDKEVDINKIRMQIGMVFQQFNLFPHLTVRRNITIALTKLRNIPMDEANATADKLLFAGIRFFGAGLFILIPYGIIHKRIPLTKRLCGNSLILGLVQTAGQYFFMYIGLAYTTGVNASVFNAVGTLLYIILAWMIYKDETISKSKMMGCIIGFSGILLNSLATQRMGMLSFKGDGFIFIANVCVAVGFLYSKHSTKNTLQYKAKHYKYAKILECFW